MMAKPAPPPGFALDGPAPAAAPITPPAVVPPPPGFVLDGSAPVKAPAEPYSPTMGEHIANAVTAVADSPVGQSFGEGGFIGDRVVNPLGRGLVSLQQQGNVIAGMTGMDSPEETAANIVENQNQKEQQFPIAPSIQAGTDNIVKGFDEGVGPGLKSLVQNPGAVVNTVVESAANSLPAMVGGLVGTGAGILTSPVTGPVGPVAGAMAGTGAGSALVDYPATVISELSAAGVDLHNQEAVAAALSNPEMMDKIRTSAAKHASVVGMFDALSGGMAGKVGKVVQKAGGKEIAGDAVEVGSQMLLGAGGEAGGQVAQSGEITSPSDVALEAVGELVPGTAEVAVGKAREKIMGNKAAAVAPTETPQVLPEQPPAVAQSPEVQAQPVPVEQGDTGQTATIPPVAAVPAAPAAVEPPAAQPVETKQPEPETVPQVTPPIAEDPQVTEPAKNVSKVVTPDGSMEIDTQDEVVPLSSLITSDNPAYDQTLQPRDRSRATSDIQIQRIASDLDPARLRDSRTTDQGAPIVGEDNMVESGNGRTAAIRTAYSGNPESAERYKQSLVAAGHSIEGIENPVLVRRRKSALSPEDRVKFASLSNKSQIAEMSSTEKAKADAAQIPDDLVDAHKGGDIANLDNRDFVRAFISKIVTGNETGALISPDGTLSQEGEKRVKAALVAKAYNNPDLVENIFESADPEVKSIGNALRDQAPAFAQLGAAVRRGNVPERFDITKQLMEAVEIIRNARRDGKRVRDVLEGTNQASMLDEPAVDPMVEKIVRSFHHDGLGRMLSQAAIDKVLKSYTDTAKEQTANDLFGENTTEPSDLIDRAYQKVTADMEAKKAGQPAGLFDAEETNSNTAQPGGASTEAAELAKTGGRKFEDVSFNRDININKQVFQDAGLNPDEAVNLAPKKQREIIARELLKKFGLVVESDGKQSVKDEIDHLADMYVGLNNMAAVLGLPPGAMSLRGNMKLILEGGKKPYLGVYSHAGSIGLPNKSNSFAHEWLHGLDHYLAKTFGAMTDKLHLFSQAARSQGVIDPEHPVQSTFANLLNALFYDKAFIAAKILELEDKIANGRTDNSRAVAEKQLKEIKAGNYGGIKGKTDFYKNARTMPNSDYFASPHEMMARALEAYVGWKMTDAGVTSRAISKLDAAYNSGADERLAKTFPKLEDRIHIFETFDQFFSALGESEILGKKSTPALQNNPEYMGVLDPKFWAMPDTAEEKTAKEMPWMKRQLEFVKADYARWKEERAIKQAEQLKNKKIMDILNPKEPGWKGFAKRLGNDLIDSSGFALWNHSFRTDRTEAHSIEKKNPAVSALRQLNDRIFTRPGKGSAVKEVYKEKITTSINRGSTVLENIMGSVKRAADGKRVRLTAEENDQLRNALLGLPVQDVKGSKLTKADFVKGAAKLRAFADQTWKDMRQAGLDVGYYEKGAWLRRHYLKEPIMADLSGFLEKAGLTYQDQFDEVFGDVDGAMNNLGDFMDVVKGILRTDPNGLTIDKKQLQELEKLIADKKTDEARAMIEDMYDEVREQYAKMAAQAWLVNLVSDKAKAEFESTFPKPGFMKQRALPVSADVHLKDYMETDVERILFHYMVAGNTAIAQKDVLNPKGAPSMKQLLDQALKDGVSSDDVTDLENTINRVMFGPEMGPRARKIGQFITLLRMGAILSNLNKVVFSAITEPMVIGLKTRNVMNSYKAYSDAIADVFKTDEGKYFKEVSDHLGAIGTDYADMMQAERFGGGFEMGLLSRDTMAKFFRYTGNTGITNHQSRVAIRAGYRWMGFLTDKYANGTEKEKSMAKRDLAELGIGGGDNYIQAFSLWLQDANGRPDLNAINNDSSSIFGADFMTAVVRFRDQAIQHPGKEDRPGLANHPVGSVLYTGLGFTFSFWDNVVKAEGAKIKNIAQTEGGAEAAKAMANHAAIIGSMLMLSMLINTLRMAVFDREKFKERHADPEGFRKLIIGRSVENLNPSPAYSILWNMYRGSAYGRDPATSMSGMVLANYFNWLQKVFDLGSERNSDNNQNSEREAVKQTYRVMAAPVLTAALLNMPGPAKLLAVPVGVASMFINSGTTADKVADTLVAPKMKGRGGGEKESEPKEPKEK